MLKIRRHLNLGEEPLDAEHGAELGVEDLEGDLALMPQVAREIDNGHPARAYFAVDCVAAFECYAQAWVH